MGLRALSPYAVDVLDRAVRVEGAVRRGVGVEDDDRAFSYTVDDSEVLGDDDRC
jgi:hypothetical protein